VFLSRPVPGLPNKSFFSFSNEDFLERRRTGLQSFLDQSVCLLFTDKQPMDYSFVIVMSQESLGHEVKDI
jgi:hypothetical protein